MNAWETLPWHGVLAMQPDELGFASDEGVGVFLFDVDRLKAVNDIEGYVAGDNMMAVFTERLREWAGDRAVVVRVAGGLFAAIVPSVADQAEANERAERLRVLLGRPVRVGRHDITRQVSIGVAAARISDVSVVDLVHRADDALQVAQQSGGNVVVPYVDQMHNDSFSRSQIEIRLGGAVRDGQFEVYYQPEVDVRNGRITAVEALLRWHHPTLGRLGATSFIAIAEQTGAMCELGEFALRTACRQRAEWLRSNPEYRYALRVNVSPYQLDDPAFVDLVAEVLDGTGVPAELLCLEITELITSRDAETAASSLEHLRESGVHIALDDFGSGHSSLRRLKVLPVDVLKIDREFVVDLARNAIDPIIVEGLVRLATAWELDLVAEGVETREAAAELLRLGCRRAQGNWFAAPAPAADLAGLLARGQVEEGLLPRRRPRPGPDGLPTGEDASAGRATGEARAPLR